MVEWQQIKYHFIWLLYCTHHIAASEIQEEVRKEDVDIEVPKMLYSSLDKAKEAKQGQYQCQDLKLMHRGNMSMDIMLSRNLYNCHHDRLKSRYQGQSRLFDWRRHPQCRHRSWDTQGELFLLTSSGCSSYPLPSSSRSISDSSGQLCIKNTNINSYDF